MIGKTWKQEPEVVGHIAAIAGKQEVINDDAQFTLFFSIPLGC